MTEIKTIWILKNIKVSFAYKVVCIDDRFTKPVVLYRGKNTVNKFIKVFLKEYECCQKVKKKHLNKNFVMSSKDEERFQSSNKCYGYVINYLMLKIIKLDITGNIEENIEAMLIGVVILILNWMEKVLQNFII